MYRNERDDLHRLGKFKRLLVVTSWFLLLWHQRSTRASARLRPTHLLIPATLAQITVLVLASLHPEKLFYIVAVGNLLIASAAMFPSTLRKKYHWVE